MSEDDLYKEEELVVIKLPRKEYEVLKVMIEREQTYDRLTGMLKSSWIWVVGGGVLTLILLWDRFHIGVIK